MITITRLNGSKIVLNSELIETLESTPDTIITLTNGKKIVVREDCNSIVERIIDYKRLVSKTRIMKFKRK